MSDKPTFSRRTTLSLAALGLAGSGTVIAKRASSNSNRVLTEYDDDSVVERDSNGWPLKDFDNGNTKYSAATTGPTGKLSVSWMLEGDYYRPSGPLIADGIVYYYEGIGAFGRQKLYAYSAEDGSKQWIADLEDDYFRQYKETLDYPYERSGMAIVDGEIYASRFKRTEVFNAETGDRLWTVKRGGTNISVTDELFLVISPLYDEKADRDPSGHRLLAMSREDGSVRWKRDFDALPSLAVSEGSAYVGNGNVSSFSLETGEFEWQHETEHSGGIVATDSNLFVEKMGGMVVLDPETGDEKWSKKGYEYEYGNANTRVYAVGDGTAYISGDDAVVAVDAATGEERWRSDAKQLSYFKFIAGGVIYTTKSNSETGGETWVLYDAETGERLGEYPTPSDTIGDGSPRLFAPANEKLYGVSEKGVFALCNKSSGNTGGSNDGDGSDGSDGSEEGC